MGDLQAWLPQQNGAVSDYHTPPSPWQPSNPCPSAIKDESMRRAEQATQEIIQRIQPTSLSEQRRSAVVEYVQKLIRELLSTELLPFGSVPLKTYLPDGDIDLTAIAVPNSDDSLASEVHSALEGEEQNKDAEFEVKDVQYIHAEVRLVKCLVQNIVVDISFNQIGGLCTLCFLEQADRLIGKDNLFKRSIILIKAWCYYESRILGAHHGLISTYALETLVLYIFHLFHSSLDGPLAVLYRFLDYYSKFDWDNYCISLHGPIPVSSLPELVAEAPENDGGELLLSKDFLRNCVEMFSDPFKGLENNHRNFSQKHLNIVDPLKESNNLGRSVSKGNFYRIRSAFTYGARKLGRILLLPADSIADEVNMFFMNTLDRHGSGERRDVQDALSSSPDSTAINHSIVDSVSSDLKVEKSREDRLILGKPTTDSHGGLCEEINTIKISGLDKEHGTRMQLCRHPSNKNLDATCVEKFTKSESNGPMEGNIVSGRCLASDARDLDRSRVLGSRSASETCEVSESKSEMRASPSGKAYHAPHLFFHPENGIRNGFSAKDLATKEETGMLIRPDSYESESLTSSSSWYSIHGISAPAGSLDGSMTSVWSTYQSEYSPLGGCTLAGNDGIGADGSPSANHLADLTGDYDMHVKSLLYAQWCREYMLGTFYHPVHQSAPSHHRSKYPWDSVRRRNMYTHVNSNGVVPGPPFSPTGRYPISPFLISGAYGMEDMPKTRGTGTYFPNMNYRPYKDRQSPGRGRNPVPTNQPPRPRSNGRAETAPDTNLLERGSQDPPSQLQVPISSGNDQVNPSLSDMSKPSLTASKSFSHATASSGNDQGKPSLSDMSKPSLTASKSFSHATAFLFPSDGKVEFGSLGPVPLGASSSDAGKRLDSVSGHSHGSGSAIPASIVQRPATNSNPERPRQSYQLKNDVDFPPLSG